MGILSKLIIVTAFFGFYIVGMGSEAKANPTERLFSQSKMLSETRHENHHYLLPLGRVKLDRSIGRDVPSRYKRLDGDFRATVWELTGGESLEEYQGRVNAYINEQRLEPMFQCAGRDCGESFSWANSVFKQATLYGNDRRQTLWVVKDRGVQRYHVFYLVERPNRRIYFYEESLSVPDLVLDETVIRELLGHQGYLILGEVVFEAGKPDLTIILDKIKRHKAAISPRLLVVHRHGNGQFSNVAEQLKQELAAAGLDFTVEDLGNRAPRAEAPGSVWLELVDEAWRP